MKFNKIGGTAGFGALALALLSTAALAQNSINLPKGVIDYVDNPDADVSEECQKTYQDYLNRVQCQAKLDAAAWKDDELKQAETDLTTAKELYEAAVKTDAEDLEKFKDAETLAKQALEAAKSKLAAEEAKLTGLKSAVETAALAVNAAEKVLIPKAVAAGVSLQEFIENPDNAGDADVVAYVAKKSSYDAEFTKLQASDLSEFTGAVTAAEGELEIASGDVTNFVPTADRTELDGAELDLETATGTYETLLSAAAKPLAPGEDANYDLLTDPKNANNPARAVLSAADCAKRADGENACEGADALASPDDVGQAIVDGFDQLYKADATLQTNIDTVQANVTKEVADRKAADVVLQQNIDKEVADRKAADVVLQANIDKEVTDRKAADVVLQQNIDKEVTDRKAADTTLQNNINAEVAARTAADVTLQNNINTVNTRVTQLGERVDSLTKESRQGIAMAMALAAIPTVNYGKFSLGLGVGTFASETAAALGMDFVVSERVKFKLGVTTTGDETGGSAGIAIGF